jgi:hypothetical protein
MQRPDGKTRASEWFEDIRSQSAACVQHDPASRGGALVIARSDWFRLKYGGELLSHWRDIVIGRCY